MRREDARLKLLVTKLLKVFHTYELCGILRRMELILHPHPLIFSCAQLHQFAGDSNQETLKETLTSMKSIIIIS